MEIEPLAFDSLGTRGMATFVRTKDAKILIDPGVSLAPLRYGLEPHPLEWQKLEKHWELIKKKARKADVLIVTHYHYDHHSPEEPEIYKGKTVLLKHPTEKINLSQKGRAAFFLQKLAGLPKKLEYSDGRTFEFGSTKIIFSQPVFHGTNDRLGFITEVCIAEKDYKFLHTSDVEGASVPEQTEFILEMKPNCVIIDGPMTYMLGYRFSYDDLKASVNNMVKIVEKCPLEFFIPEHHFLRDLNYRGRIDEVYAAASKKGVKVITAAEFLGKKVEMLEARRRELYGKASASSGAKAKPSKKIIED